MWTNADLDRLLKIRETLSSNSKMEFAKLYVDHVDYLMKLSLRLNEELALLKNAQSKPTADLASDVYAVLTKHGFSMMPTASS